MSDAAGSDHQSQWAILNLSACVSRLQSVGKWGENEDTECKMEVEDRGATRGEGVGGSNHVYRFFWK